MCQGPVSSTDLHDGCQSFLGHFYTGCSGSPDVIVIGCRPRRSSVFQIFRFFGKTSFDCFRCDLGYGGRLQIRFEILKTVSPELVAHRRMVFQIMPTPSENGFSDPWWHGT